MITHTRVLDKHATYFFDENDKQRGVFLASSVILSLCIWLFTALQTHYSSSEATQKAIARQRNHLPDHQRTFSPRQFGLFCD
ncbi:hypothetical protein [Vibrio europaeus]|uniref:Uncharacterized protein n=1 Tax=Vibrio europaeus TaxID=300876 RepID=A0ABT5H3B2_9VIBR|nr:hypothetical protein [Vibrio europaeus]MDC5706712.1 hypothetical protein [Vibrio europaeus]MDC5711754.1 hypothetical protein [Vibrio europaeus]MDC5716553.1 hypothetical protein [Vibrio europaeus]MDC5725852.1 hypothetical protein [Vibrio europaeus]MDC5732841.1 hypothetical protein [Vibrio europaeus]